MHCKVHDSLLGLPVDLQSGPCLSHCLHGAVLVGIGLSVAGAKCTNCSRDVSSKPRLVVAAGVTLFWQELLLLVAVSWTAHAIVLGFYDPMLEETGKREFAATATSGGGSVPPRVNYTPVKTMSVNGYTRRDYV
ncbi:Claudin-4 [Nibea albiflora]|uniref:Claudin-4 n=1 Tax=Nibea albiflora TaxID=240163 RepID=A0ACB7EI83_NIBAL|nr:Claudin-4 [Nibea albiflora]